MKYIRILCIAGLLMGCSNEQIDKKEDQQKYYDLPSGGTVTYTVEEALQWSALFKRNSGWFGGDGIFAIPQNGIEAPGSASATQTIFLFSDTMIGEITEDGLQEGFSMVNNSVAYLQGDEPRSEHIEFVWRKNADGSPGTLFVPRTEQAEEGDYYWLGDGFVNKAKDNATYLFAYRVRNTGEGIFPFEVVGNPIIKIPAGSEPPFDDHTQITTPLFMENEGPHAFGSFGAGIFVNTKWAGAPDPDGYVYIYGVQGENKELIAARVKPEAIEDFSEWRYWDGSGWSPDIEALRPIVEGVSNELSVHPVSEDTYALVFQVAGFGSDKVGMRMGGSPVGPFGELEEVYTCPETQIDSSFFTYNAKAHPNISQPGELLISYNVNSFEFFEKITEYPHLYRPRFIRVTFGGKDGMASR